MAADFQDPSVELWISEYRNLNRRRLFGAPPLEVGELERWAELRSRLTDHFGEGMDGGAAAERREHLRLPTHLKVVFASGDALREAWLENISEGGIFIQTARPLDTGSPLRLVIIAEAGPPLEIAGRVAWVRPSADGAAGMGVRFEDVDAEQRDALDALLDVVAASF